uniref:gp53-like domain-containing protein n=1 Tax=Megasphaera sp. TaxID=2023260 RepID=UPI004024B3EC
MAKFANLTFTSQGTQMLVQAQNSHRLTFTCGKLGSGVLADSDDISKFTDLKCPKMTLPIVSVDDSNEEKLVLTFDTSNTELEEGFVSREIGIFAKLDNGAETLYAYSNAGNNYDYIPSKDTPSDENRLVVNLVVSSSANISVQIDKSIVYTHKSDVEEMIATHNASDTAHETRFKLFEKIADFGNDIIKKMAITTAITAITALETNSWFGQLLKMVLTASGVKYNIAQNGYVCLGSFFGGLIIQWGIATGSTAEAHVTSAFNVTLPINYQKQIAQVLVNTANGGTNNTWESTTVWAQGETVKSFVGYMVAGHPFTTTPKIRWVTLGK